MRFGMIAAAAAALMCAGQAHAARYYEFQITGAAERPGVFTGTGYTSNERYDSISTFAFDTLIPSPNFGYFAAGNTYLARLETTDTIGNLSTVNSPTGPVYNLSFALADVALGTTLTPLKVNNTGFGYIIRPDSRYSTTVSFGGQILSILARTSDTAPANLGLVERLTVTAVPEPATWAMMILGMGAVGYAMRRRRGRVADAVAVA